MACCGAPKNIENIGQLFKQLRNDNEIIQLKLDKLKLDFIPKEKGWKSNYMKITKIIFFNNSKYKRSITWIFI